MPFSVLQAFAVESATAFHLVTMRPSPAKLQRRQACSPAAFQHVLEVDKEILDEVVVDSKPIMSGYQGLLLNLVPILTRGWGL